MNDLIVDLQTETKKNKLRLGLPPLQFQKMMTFVLNAKAIGMSIVEIVKEVNRIYPDAKVTENNLYHAYKKFTSDYLPNEEEIKIVIIEFNARFMMAIKGAAKNAEETGDWSVFNKINVEYYKFLQSIGYLPSVAQAKDEVQQNKESVFMSMLLEVVREKNRQKAGVIINGNVKDTTEKA